MNRYPNKKYSIYQSDGVELRELEDRYFEESYSPTICAEHIIIAHMIKDLVRDMAARDALLHKVDVVYDMGKRMGKRLVEQYNKRGLPWEVEGF